MKISTKALVGGAVMAALAIALKFTSITTMEYRFTFYDIPLMIAGIAFGPLVGGIAGFITDWIYATTQGWPIGLFTLSSIAWGLVPGLMMMALKKVDVKRLVVIVIVTSFIAFSLNTFALYQFQGSGVLAMLPARLVTMVIKWPIQVIVVKAVYERVILPLKFNLAK